MTIRQSILASAIRSSIRGSFSNGGDPSVLVMTVGTDGGDLYGYDSVAGYGTLSQDTFLGVPIYSCEADVAKGVVYFKMGDAGDEQIPNIPSMRWNIEGYGLVTFTWDVTWLDYSIADPALVQFFVDNLDLRITAQITPLVVHDPITDSPDWSLASGNASMSVRESDGVVVYYNKTVPDAFIGYQSENFADGAVEAQFLHRSTDNTMSSFPLAMRIDPATGNFIGVRSYDSQLQVIARVDGIWTNVFNVATPVSSNYTVMLECQGSDVSLYYDGEMVNSGTTTHLTAGVAGMVARAHPATAVSVLNGFNVTVGAVTHTVTNDGEAVTHNGGEVTHNG